MTGRSNRFLGLVAGGLLCLGIPSAAHCESALEQLEEVAGRASVRAPDPALAGMLAGQRNRERFWAGKIEKIERAIRKCDEQIRAAEALVARAQGAGKAEAEALARQNLAKARNLRQGYQEQKSKAEVALRRAREAVKHLTASPTDGAVPADLRGVVTRASGEVSLLRSGSGSGATSLTGSQVGCLAPGDEIRTGPDGGADLQILGGRGAMTLGERSKLRVEADQGEAEVVRTLEGKFRFAVEKAEAVQAELEEELSAILEKLGKMTDDPKGDLERYLKNLRARLQKKFEVKTRGGGTASVRGTEFLVEERRDGSADLAVLEGKVEASEAGGGKSVTVETGQAVSVSPEGRLSGVRRIDPAAIPIGWESDTGDRRR